MQKKIFYVEAALVAVVVEPVEVPVVPVAPELTPVFTFN
jgi:hypothetical protein